MVSVSNLNSVFDGTIAMRLWRHCNLTLISVASLAGIVSHRNRNNNFVMNKHSFT
jgi:hypothetical protein